MSEATRKFNKLPEKYIIL